MTAIGSGITIPFGSQQGFNPFAFGRPFILLDAAKGITLNGADVSDWDDQSGDGNDVSQSTAADQPLFNVSDSDFNNNPSVEGDGVSEFISRASFVGGAQSQPNTIFIVYKWVDNVGVQTCFDGASGARHLYDLNATQAHMLSTASINIHTEDTNTHVFAGLFNDASSNSWRDGIETTPASGIGSLDFNGLFLFAAFVPAAFAALKIAYFTAFPGELSDIALNYNGNGLAARFGTTWTNI